MLTNLAQTYLNVGIQIHKHAKSCTFDGPTGSETITFGQSEDQTSPQFYDTVTLGKVKIKLHPSTMVQ